MIELHIENAAKKIIKGEFTHHHITFIVNCLSTGVV